jgi:hypothetical protein
MIISNKQTVFPERILEYWQNFEKVIKKAITAATSPEVNLKLEDHFSDVTKMIPIGKSGKPK